MPPPLALAVAVCYYANLLTLCYYEQLTKENDKENTTNYEGINYNKKNEQANQITHITIFTYVSTITFFWVSCCLS